MGFTHAWFYDTELLNADVFVAMAAAAMNTTKIKLCTACRSVEPDRAGGGERLGLAQRAGAGADRVRPLDRFHRARHPGAAGDHAWPGSRNMSASFAGS